METISSDIKGDGNFGNSEIVKVCDMQEFDFEDFEFMQKLQAPRQFIMRAYNKTNNPNMESPAIQFQCSSDSQYFVMTHLIEKYLPTFWRTFFEKSLVITPPDLY